MQQDDGDIAARTRVIRWIAILATVAGLAVSAGLGALGRQMLVAQGFPVPSWSESFSCFVPLALLFEATVLVYAITLFGACRSALLGKSLPPGRYLLAVMAPSVHPEPPCRARPA